jgi:hypothetical protein
LWVGVGCYASATSVRHRTGGCWRQELEVLEELAGQCNSFVPRNQCSAPPLMDQLHLIPLSMMHPSRAG